MALIAGLPVIQNVPDLFKGLNLTAYADAPERVNPGIKEFTLANNGLSSVVLTNKSDGLYFRKYSPYMGTYAKLTIPPNSVISYGADFINQVPEDTPGLGITLITNLFSLNGTAEIAGNLTIASSATLDVTVGTLMTDETSEIVLQGTINVASEATLENNGTFQIVRAESTTRTPPPSKICA